MHRLLLGAALAAAVFGSVAPADAGSRHRHHHHARTMWTAPVAARPVGPAWAGPNQCFTDEGYGRFSPCDGRR